jgi:hypothetical protein
MHPPTDRPELELFSELLVRAMAGLTPWLLLMSESRSWLTDQGNPVHEERRERMMGIVGRDRMQDGLFVRANGTWPLSGGPRMAYRPSEVIGAIPRCSTDLRIYPGRADWVAVAKEMARLAQSPARRGDDFNGGATSRTAGGG